MIKNVFDKVLNFTKEHNPEILVGLGVAGMMTSTVLAVKATPKALDIMEDKKADLGVTYLTRKEIAQATWKLYAPSIGVGLASAACIILGTSKSIKRNTALATVYALSESTLREYQSKAKEMLGEEKAAELDREVAKARVRKREVTTIVETEGSEYIHHTGNGDTLVYDSLSGRYFRSSKNAIESAVNSINKSLLNDYIMTLNEFYNEMCVPTIGAGSLIGWKSDKELLEVSFESDVDQNGNPYLVLSYKNRPIPVYDYRY